MKTKHRQIAMNKITTTTQAWQLHKSCSSQSQLCHSHCMCLLFLNYKSQSHNHRYSLLEDKTPHYTPLYEVNRNHCIFIQHQSALFLQSASKTLLFSWIMNSQTSDFKVRYGEKERRNSIFKRDIKVENEEAWNK